MPNTKTTTLQLTVRYNPQVTDPDMKELQLTITKRFAEILRAALSYALSNLDDLNDATDNHIQEAEVEALHNLVSVTAREASK
jgi:predicted solute-binding protein